MGEALVMAVGGKIVSQLVKYVGKGVSNIKCSTSAINVSSSYVQIERFYAQQGSKFLVIVNPTYYLLGHVQYPAAIILTEENKEVGGSFENGMGDTVELVAKAVRDINDPTCLNVQAKVSTGSSYDVYCTAVSY